MVLVTLADGSVLDSTDGHPIWDATTGRFTTAAALHVGDKIETSNDQLITITALTGYTGYTGYTANLTAYNLQISTIHTYYAGTTPVLVHNSCAGPGESSAWKQFDAFRVRTKTNGLSGSDRQYYEWDHTHNNIEVYNRRGVHLGVMNPETGEMTGGPVAGRRITP